MSNRIRQALYNGYARNPLSIIIAIIIATLFYLYMRLPADVMSKLFNLTSAVAAILSAIAISLRNRSLDLYLKILSMHRKPHNAGDTGHILTHLILLSFMTSVINLVLPLFVSEQLSNTDYFLYAMCVFLSSFCAMQYIYALFSFEKLEDLTISNALYYTSEEIITPILEKTSEKGSGLSADEYPDEWKD